MKKWDLRRQMAAGGLVIGILFGFAGGYAAHKFRPSAGEDVAVKTDEAVKVKSRATDPNGRQMVVLSDGRAAEAQSVVFDASGARYLVGRTWYKGQ